MKRIILVLLALVPFFASAQADSVAFKGAKQIVIKTGLPATESYRVVVSSLLDQGYFLEQKDESLLTAKTQARQTSKRSYPYFFNIRAKDNEVILSGSFKTGVELNLTYVTAKDDYLEIVNRGMNGSAFKITFNTMDDFAKSLNKPLEYH